MAQPADALHFREIMGRMMSRRSYESLAQAFLVAPISLKQPRHQRDEIIELVRRHMADLINGGDVYYVSPEITHHMAGMADRLAETGQPFHFYPEDFPSFFGLVYFDGLFELPTAYPEQWVSPDALDALRALAWGQMRVEGDDVVGKVVYTWVDNKKLPEMGPTFPWIARHWMPMRYTEPLQASVFQRESINEFEAEDLSDAEVDRMLLRQQQAAEKIARLLYVWTQFLKTEIASAHRYDGVSRRHREVMEQEGRPLPPFRVVTLRRYAPTGDEAEIAGPLHLSHRFKVRGHWRMQRVGPGRAFIRPTPVMEYWKGPEHLPKDLRETVQAVVR